MGCEAGREVREGIRDVWFPYYPLCTDHSVMESFAMVYEVYREMLKAYQPENIAFVGFSSGAALALGVCLHNNAQPEPLPMPGLIIALSPGSVPGFKARRLFLRLFLRCRGNCPDRQPMAHIKT